ncbi:DUF5786 family protein [Haloferax sp. S1W]|uniref:DUF5786 family protein n=1 Tax=Haloferax sp. S1W TaxID=3377110 RepID=UPI0037C70F1E
MGFGSYDESEQGDQNVDFDEEDGVETSEAKHEGEIDFEIGASNDELLDKLKDIKEE